MKLNLKKDLIFFDIESTGLNVVTDRILQIAFIKLKKDGTEETLELLINPSIPISKEAMEVHGITPQMLTNKPVFSQVAQQIYDFIGTSDLAGYNSNGFDIPMLIEEFGRVGLSLDMVGRKTIDVQRLFYKMEPRTLKAAHRFYTGHDMENAHDALADVKATIAVLEGQLDKYKDTSYEDRDGNIIPNAIENDMKSLHKFTNDMDFVDGTRRLKYDSDRVIVFNFGKFKNQPVGQLLSKDKSYYNWILNGDFSMQVKDTIKRLVKEYDSSK